MIHKIKANSEDTLPLLKDTLLCNSSRSGSWSYHQCIWCGRNV